MTKKQTGIGEAVSQAETAKALRKRAEEAVTAKHHVDLGEPPPGEVRAMYHMLHELRVHQAELEMQNEELRQTRESLEAARAKYFDLYNLAPAGYFTISGKGFTGIESHRGQIAGHGKRPPGRGAVHPSDCRR